MLVQGEALVLGEDVDLPQPAVDAVGEGEVDDAVGAAEGHRGLGPVAGERIQALALPPGQNEREGAALQLSRVQVVTPSTDRVRAFQASSWRPSSSPAPRAPSRAAR